MKKYNCILLIDDDDVANYLNEQVIERMKIADHTHAVLNGSEALNFVKDNCVPVPTPPCPDLILLDIKMPVMNGFEFLQELEKVRPTLNKDFKVILVSSSRNPKDEEQSKNFNVDGFIHKPLSEEKLKQFVN